MTRKLGAKWSILLGSFIYSLGFVLTFITIKVQNIPALAACGGSLEAHQTGGLGFESGIFGTGRRGEDSERRREREPAKKGRDTSTLVQYTLRTALV